MSQKYISESDLALCVRSRPLAPGSHKSYPKLLWLKCCVFLDVVLLVAVVSSMGSRTMIQFRTTVKANTINEMVEMLKKADVFNQLKAISDMYG